MLAQTKVSSTTCNGRMPCWPNTPRLRRSLGLHKAFALTQKKTGLRRPLFEYRLLPSVVSERLVRLGHFMGIFLFLDRGAGVVEGVQ